MGMSVNCGERSDKVTMVKEDTVLTMGCATATITDVDACYKKSFPTYNNHANTTINVSFTSLPYESFTAYIIHHTYAFPPDRTLGILGSGKK